MIELKGEAPHLGSLSVPGFFNVIVVGADWCQPCKLVLREIPRWAEQYPQAVFTYIDIVDDGTSISRYTKMNGLDTIPYVYVSNECGVGLNWLKSDADVNKPFSAKIEMELRARLGPPMRITKNNIDSKPQVLTMQHPHMVPSTRKNGDAAASGGGSERESARSSSEGKSGKPRPSVPAQNVSESQPSAPAKSTSEPRTDVPTQSPHKPELGKKQTSEPTSDDTGAEQPTVLSDESPPAKPPEMG
ncbi:MAG: thioredoxin family protein [Myxococcales bacterium]|nr:thioredoxin family protein [Myxococcales bacterium]